MRTVDRDWSKADIKTLKAAYKDPAVRIADIAADFNRSDGAVRQKAHALGLKRRNPTKAKRLKAVAAAKKTARVRAAR